MITLSQIARESGVSPATVSVILRPTESSGNVRVSEATRLRVTEKARELGYRPNAMARAVVTGKNKAVAFLVNHLDGAYLLQVLAGAQQVATRAGYFIHLIPLGDSAESARAAVERCAEHRVSAALALTMAPDALEILKREAQTYRFPVAALDDVPELNWGVRVTSDNWNGVRQAFEHLHQLGHTRFAYLTGPHTSNFARERAAAFTKLLQMHDLSAPADHLVWGDWWNPDLNEPLIEGLLRDVATRPTALMCASDWSAVAALRVARRLELRVPDDLSVIGFGNQSLAHFADPPLSTIEQRFDLMGEVAMTKLLERCAVLEANPDDQSFTDPFDVKIEPHLIFRGSTGPAA